MNCQAPEMAKPGTEDPRFAGDYQFLWLDDPAADPETGHSEEQEHRTHRQTDNARGARVTGRICLVAKVARQERQRKRGDPVEPAEEWNQRDQPKKAAQHCQSNTKNVHRFFGNPFWLLDP